MRDGSDAFRIAQDMKVVRPVAGNQSDARKRAEQAWNNAKNNPSVSQRDKDALKAAYDAAKAREEEAIQKGGGHFLGW